MHIIPLHVHDIISDLVRWTGSFWMAYLTCLTYKSNNVHAWENARVGLACILFYMRSRASSRLLCSLYSTGGSIVVLMSLCHLCCISTVPHPPTVVQVMPITHQLLAGQENSVTFTCLATFSGSIPIPTFSLLSPSDGSPLPLGGKWSVSTVSMAGWPAFTQVNVTILNLTLADTGSYVCFFQSDCGNASTAVNLTTGENPSRQVDCVCWYTFDDANSNIQVTCIQARAVPHGIIGLLAFPPRKGNHYARYAAMHGVSNTLLESLFLTQTYTYCSV